MKNSQIRQERTKQPYFVLPPAEILYGVALLIFLLFAWVPGYESKQWDTLTLAQRIAFGVGVPGVFLFVAGFTIFQARVLWVDGHWVIQRWMNLVEIRRYDLRNVVEIQSSRDSSKSTKRPTLRIMFPDDQYLVIPGSCWNYQRFSLDLAAIAERS